MTAPLPVSRTGATDREVEADVRERNDAAWKWAEANGGLANLPTSEVFAFRDGWDAARAAAAPDSGAALIAAERARQVEQEGWTPEHDAEHAGEGLALAACCYAVPPQMRKYRVWARPVSSSLSADPGGPQTTTVPTLWPWHRAYWKPCPEDRVRELVKAGALIAAEIDRLRAAALLAEQPGGGR